MARTSSILVPGMTGNCVNVKSVNFRHVDRKNLTPDLSVTSLTCLRPFGCGRISALFVMARLRDFPSRVPAVVCMPPISRRRRQIWSQHSLFFHTSFRSTRIKLDFICRPDTHRARARLITRNETETEIFAVQSAFRAVGFRWRHFLFQLGSTSRAVGFDPFEYATRNSFSFAIFSWN